MDTKVLSNLQWPSLVENLALHAQTDPGRLECLELIPNKGLDAVRHQWSLLEPLRDLARSGYRAPVGQLGEMKDIFHAAGIGQILDGESLRAVFTLLETVRSVHRFTTDFQDRCPPLKRFHSGIYPLPKLSQAIAKAIGPDGEILDDATPELSRIRQQKVALRKRIEQHIKQLLTDQELEGYLQDKFFTMRSERYVVPMRLDGRGRIKGSIHDTSESGQTLYIEPTSVQPLNENLLELDLNEKLEILRIFRELSEAVQTDLEILKANFSHLVELDVLSAKASFAAKLDAGSVNLVNQPVLDLRTARHPLLNLEAQRQPVANHISLGENQYSLIVSGPNAGGKTVVLKTVGLLHLMAKAGLLIPADRESQLYLYANVRVEIGDSQNLAQNLSTFSGHLMGLKPILERATREDLVLLDELAVGTEPQTGSALAQAVLEDLGRRQVMNIVTTHYDALKGLAQVDRRFRNGSMEFSTKSLKPTYRLILDVPGQSYGIEVAEQLGLPAMILSRAKELRGNTALALDELVRTLQAAREEAQQEELQGRKARLALEQEKAHWEQEKKNLEEARGRQALKLKERYDDDFDALKSEYQALVEETSQLLKTLKKGGEAVLDRTGEELKRLKASASSKTERFGKLAQNIKDEFKGGLSLPGVAAALEDLKLGLKVFVVSLEKQAVVTKIGDGAQPVIEVQAGLVRLRPSLQDLRILGPIAPRHPKSPKLSPQGAVKDTAPITTPGFVLQTPTNSIDVRGHESEKALEKTWQFIDRAVLRGESTIVIVHGHGADKLKKTIRIALAQQSPYKLNFRPGETEEGGDGVTVIKLDS